MHVLRHGTNKKSWSSEYEVPYIKFLYSQLILEVKGFQVSKFAAQAEPRCCTNFLLSLLSPNLAREIFSTMNGVHTHSLVVGSIHSYILENQRGIFQFRLFYEPSKKTYHFVKQTILYTKLHLITKYLLTYLQFSPR